MFFIKKLFKIVLLIGLVYFITGFSATPRLDRNWTDDQLKLTSVKFEDKDNILIKNIRNVSYKSTTDYDAGYHDSKINLNNLETAWFLVEPFGKFGAAHTLVSFGFADGTYIAISVELRKEVGEHFSPFAGVLRQYELIYVVADESDVIKLRTNYRKDDVRLYPISASKEKIRAVFVDMLQRTDGLTRTPEFYNTITNNCTTNIVKHVRKFSDKDIPWYDFRYLAPATVDTVAYNAGIIKTDLSLDDARNKFYITDKAQKCSDTEDFSVCIRK